MLKEKDLQSKLQALNNQATTDHPMEVKLKTYAVDTVCASHHLISTMNGTKLEVIVLTSNEYDEICALSFFEKNCKGLGSITTEKRPVAELFEAIRGRRIENVLKP